MVKISSRIRLYLCPDCGELVSCVRKQRRHPGRMCHPAEEKCVDFTKCRIRLVYNIRKIKAILADPAKAKRFYKKYSVHYTQCGNCRRSESLFGAKDKAAKMRV